MKIIAIADTHGYHELVDVPDGDVLLVAGDFCPYGNLTDVEEFSTWLLEQPCRHKIIVAGNHDEPFQWENDSALQALTRADPNIIYLQDSSINIEGIAFYGSPWTPTFMNWYFMADRGAAIHEKWAMIPKNVDVLITHGHLPRSWIMSEGFPRAALISWRRFFKSIRRLMYLATFMRDMVTPGETKLCLLMPVFVMAYSDQSTSLLSLICDFG